AVVVAGSLGTGRFVALSDPSVLINDMLGFDGNLAFAANLLRFLAPVRPGRLFLVSGDARLSGEPRTAPAEGEPLSLNEGLSEVVRSPPGVPAPRPPAPVFRPLALLAGVAVLPAAVVALPLRRVRDPDASFARVAAEPASMERLVADYDDDAPDRNFA